MLVCNRAVLAIYRCWVRSYRRLGNYDCVLLQKETTEGKRSAPNCFWCCNIALNHASTTICSFWTFVYLFAISPLCPFFDTSIIVSQRTGTFRWTKQLQQVIEKIRGTDVHLRPADVVMGKKFATGGNGQIHEGVFNGNINVALKESFGSVMNDDRFYMFSRA